MSLGPTHLLAIAVALFFAPAVYMLSVSLLEAQGALGSVGATLSPAAETALWMAAIVALIGPLSFPKILQGATRTNRLIVASSCSVAGSGIGTVLAILGAGTRPTLILGAAAMLAILGTLAAIYWLIAVRRREITTPPPGGPPTGTPPAPASPPRPARSRA